MPPVDWSVKSTLSGGGPLVELAWKLADIVLAIFAKAVSTVNCLPVMGHGGVVLLTLRVPENGIPPHE